MLMPAVFLLQACEKQGPMESAGEKVDEIIEDLKEDTETTGNKIDDAIHEVPDDIDDTPE